MPQKGMKKLSIFHKLLFADLSYPSFSSDDLFKLLLECLYAPPWPNNTEFNFGLLAYQRKLDSSIGQIRDHLSTWPITQCKFKVRAGATYCMFEQISPKSRYFSVTKTYRSLENLLMYHEATALICILSYTASNQNRTLCFNLLLKFFCLFSIQF